MRTFVHALLVLSTALPQVALAQALELPFEGFLTSADETPVSGMVTLDVRIYDTDAGGTPLFEETHTVLVSVGFVFLRIGSIVRIPAELFSAGERYVGLALSGDDEFAPRFRVGFVPFAVRSLSSEVPGPAGPAGAAGPVGPVGPEGAVGPVGPVGPAGVAGPVGPMGPAGVAGPVGATGSAGIQGPIGPTGAQGVIGTRGPTGAQGPIGLTGPQGAAGAQGPIGLTGPQGAVGAQGPIGLTGPQGAAGAQGPIGLTGPQGAAGAAGAAGAQGPIGLTGPQGAAGAAGAAGAQGPIGLTGPQGAAGAAGAAGAQGPIGLTGAQGAAGAQGPIGLTGPQGPAGAAGAQGPIGLTGAQGAIGPTGAAGPSYALGLASQAIVSTAIEIRASGDNCGDPQAAPAFEVYVNGNFINSFFTTGALADYTIAAPVAPWYVDEVAVYFNSATEVGPICTTTMTLNSILINGTRVFTNDLRTSLRDLGNGGFDPFDGFDVLPADGLLTQNGSWRFFIAPYRRFYFANGTIPETAAMSR